MKCETRVPQHATRREWWIDRHHQIWDKPQPWPESEETLSKCCILFREVMPGEVTLTRERFRHAFGAAFCEPGNTHKEMDSTLGLAVEKMLFGPDPLPEGTQVGE